MSNDEERLLQWLKQSADAQEEGLIRLEKLALRLGAIAGLLGKVVDRCAQKMLEQDLRAMLVEMETEKKRGEQIRGRHPVTGTRSVYRKEGM